MRLADFILDNMECILREWEAFARDIQPATGSMTTVALRDHAEAMLNVIVTDLNTPQTEHQSVQKSRGRAPINRTETAAQTHADERLKSGFSIALLAAEYRALRSSVLRLWLKDNREYTESDSSDMIRFNEAIDQALAESVENYTRLVIDSQDIFLGILGHDLRAPLQSVSAGAAYLMRAQAVDSRTIQLGARMYNSAARMSEMLDDLLDYTRIRIGGGLTVSRHSVDLSAVCAQIIDEFLATYPGRVIRSVISGNCWGNWDGRRIGQACQNLIGNALQYSAPDSEVEVTIQCDENEAEILVRNQGTPIPPAEQHSLFDPLRRHVASRSQETATVKNLGLGLYITREIVMAHHGAITLRSSEAEGTLFKITLPKTTDREAGPLLSGSRR